MGTMDVALSDLLTCPRCGPMYGLVLLPYEVSDRRVRSGVLGCANCRERYPVEGGVADLRVAVDEVGAHAGSEGGGRAVSSGARRSSGDRARSADSAGPADGATESDAAGASTDAAGAGVEAPEVRLAGLMGLAEAHGTVLLAGAVVAHAAALSALVEGVEVVAEVSGSESGSPESRSPESGRSEPARSGPPGPWAGVSRLRLGGVLPFRSGSLRGVALTGASAGLLEEGARVLGGAGRLVLDPAPEDAAARLESAGLAVVAEEGGVVVAARRT